MRLKPFKLTTVGDCPHIKRRGGGAKFLVTITLKLALNRKKRRLETKLFKVLSWSNAYINYPVGQLYLELVTACGLGITQSKEVYFYGQ